MPPRILIDTSAQLRSGGPTTNLIRRVELEIGRRLLEDAALLVLPVTLRTGVIYEVDWNRAAALRRGSRRRRFRRLGTLATSAALEVISLAPERKRRGLVQRLEQVRSAFLASGARGTPAPLELGRISTEIRPARTDILLLCDPYLGGHELQWLAVAKATLGFRLATISYGLDRTRTDVAGQTLNQIDASDLIFCISENAEHELHQFAIQNGRPTPDSRVLPFEDWEACAAVVKKALLQTTRKA